MHFNSEHIELISEEGKFLSLILGDSEMPS